MKIVKALSAILLGLFCGVFVWQFGRHCGVEPQVSKPPTFDDLLDAIEWVESKGDANAVGDKIDGTEQFESWGHFKYSVQYLETDAMIYMTINDNPYTIRGEPYAGGIKVYEYQAVGSFQLHKSYVDDVNKICGNLFTYEDRWDKQQSRSMTNIYLHWYASKENTGRKPTLEDAARIHNGGPDGWKEESTKAYWQKVKERLDRGQSGN